MQVLCSCNWLSLRAFYNASGLDEEGKAAYMSADIDLSCCSADFRKGTVTPRVVPFQISLHQAQLAFEQWQQSHWLAPSKLLRRGLISMHAALLPFWLFEATVHVEYTGTRPLTVSFLCVGVQLQASRLLRVPCSVLPNAVLLKCWHGSIS